MTDLPKVTLPRLNSDRLTTLTIIGGNLAIILIFGLLEPRFLSARNFVSLILQMSGIFITAIGVVYVLLIAEIDLSIAYVGAVCSVTMTLLLRNGFDWWIAVPAALLLSAFIGLLHGLLITKARAPSFAVTLAGLLVWSGVVLILTTQFSTTGTLIIQDPIVVGIANSYIPQAWSWGVSGGALALFTTTLTLRQLAHASQGLPTRHISILVVEVVLMSTIVLGATWYANQDRGVPIIAVICLLFLVFWSFIADQTRFGRYVYAVGGSPEAARRAGINVDRVRILVFMISSFMAGIGGIIFASRLRSVDTNTGGGNLLLNAIAAAIIGGTSLFGGRGHVSNALFGALIITSLENGMGLLGLPSGVRIFVNGIVLLIAVLIDALSHRTKDT